MYSDLLTTARRSTASPHIGLFEAIRRESDMAEKERREMATKGARCDYSYTFLIWSVYVGEGD